MGGGRRKASLVRRSGSSTMKIKIYKEEVRCGSSRVKGPIQVQINLRNVMMYNKRLSIHGMVIYLSN